jgi:predicted alpha/beta superfamily hydrolase
MSKRLGILILSSTLLISPVFAQSNTVSSNPPPLNVERNTQQSFIMSSKYTQHDYLIQLSVPSGEVPAEGFPVLYLLDGNAAFESASNIARSLGGGGNRLGLSPVAIVAIGYPQQKTFDVQKRALDYTPKASAEFQKQAKYPYGGADQFLQFIEKELKPEIQKKIKINLQQQSLFGHSFGGLFVLHTFFTQPQSFQRYIATSPSLWFDDYALLQTQANWLKNKNKPTPNLMLMTTVGTHEHGKSPTPDAESLQKQNNFYANFSQLPSTRLKFWNYKHPAEQHITNLYASLPKAILLAGCQPLSCMNLFDEPTQ